MSLLPVKDVFTELSVYSGSVSDKVKKYFTDLGYSSSLSVDDYLYQALDDLGYTGSVQDKWHSYYNSVSSFASTIFQYALTGPFVPQFIVDLENGVYLKDGEFTSNLTDALTFSRASTGHALDEAGDWVSFASGAPRFDWRLGGRRHLIEAAATNKIQAYWSPTGSAQTFINNAPGGAGVLSVVDDTAALVAAGLSGLTNGKVYKLDNSGGTGASRLAFLGTFNSTANFVMSAYMRGAVGGENIRIRCGYGAYSPITSATTAYVKLKEDYTTRTGATNAADVMWAEVGAGQIAYICCPQAVEGTLAHTSPIPVNGAAATRASDATTKSLAAFDFTSALSVVFSGRLAANLGDDVLAELSDGTANNRVSLYYKAASSKLFCKVVAGGVQQTDTDLGVAIGADTKIGVSATAGGALVIVADGVEKLAATGKTLPAVDRLAVGADHAAANVPAILLHDDLWIYEGALSSAALQAVTGT